MSASADREALWAAYIVARAKAHASNDIADGIAAGFAWAAFLAAFIDAPRWSADQIAAGEAGENVTPLRRHGSAG